jgi:hypothetical protein
MERVFIVSLRELPAEVQRCQAQLHHPTCFLPLLAAVSQLSFQFRRRLYTLAYFPAYNSGSVCFRCSSFGRSLMAMYGSWG